MERLDVAYEDRLARLQALRRHVAEAATLAADIRAHIAELEQLPDDAARAQLAELRRLLPGVAEAERQLTAKTQRMQARVDFFRTRKETLKAGYLAALTGRSVREAITALGETIDVFDDEAAQRLDEITRQMDQELGQGDAAVQGRRGEAVALSARVLERVRAGQDPEAAEHPVDDPLSFLEEFLPGRAEDAEAAAAALIAGNHARTVGELASHVEVLGGRLEVIADFGEDRIQLT